MSSIISYPAFYISISLTVIGIFGLIFVITWWRLLGNSGWKLYTSEHSHKPIPYKEKIEVWRSESPQIQGMYCKLDLGRERSFDFIRFYHGNSNETPRKWQMWFYRKDGSYALRGRRPYIETGDSETEQNTVAIIVKLKQPISALIIEVKISEPEKSYQWCIKAIRLRVILLHSLVKHTIGKCWLDRV